MLTSILSNKQFRISGLNQKYTSIFNQFAENDKFLRQRCFNDTQSQSQSQSQFEETLLLLIFPNCNLPNNLLKYDQSFLISANIST